MWQQKLSLTFLLREKIYIFCFPYLNKIPISQIVHYMKFSSTQRALSSHLICFVNEMRKPFSLFFFLQQHKESIVNCTFNRQDYPFYNFQNTDSCSTLDLCIPDKLILLHDYTIFYIFNSIHFDILGNFQKPRARDLSK